jgi:hypothetical protein
MPVEAQASPLDIRDEQARLGGEYADLYGAVIDLQGRLDLLPAAVRPRDSLSVRTEGERQRAVDLARRYRELPEGERALRPALLNAVGKLELAAGDPAAAHADFLAAAGLLDDPSAQGEAHVNAYRAALERQDLDGAFKALITAVKLDGRRFSPFPVGKYHPLKILGAGGFGVAFLCKHKYLDAQVVVKTFTPDDLDRPVEQVFAEAQALQKIQHPAIARLQDCGYADPAAESRPFLVMDYFEGVTLERYVKEHGLLSEADLRALARQMAEGLKAAHDKGVLHRDVKPANLLVRRDRAGWHAQFIDFGLALRQDSATPLTPRQRQTLIGSALAGTLDYAAPEQLGKIEGVKAGPYSDVYAFGRTCCYALFQSPQPLRKHWQSLPEGLANLLEGCLQENPADRPADFVAVLAALDDLDVVTGPDGSAPLPDDLKLLPLEPEPARTVEPVEAIEAVEELPVARVMAPPPREVVYVAPRANRPPARPARGRPVPRRPRDDGDDTNDEASGPPVWVWVAGGGTLCLAIAAAVVLLIVWRSGSDKDSKSADSKPATTEKPDEKREVADNSKPANPGGNPNPRDERPDPTVPPGGGGIGPRFGGFNRPPVGGGFPQPPVGGGGGFPQPPNFNDKPFFRFGNEGIVSVHVHIIGDPTVTVNTVVDRLKPLVDTPADCLVEVNSVDTTRVGVITIGPVRDPDAFARKISFGEMQPREAGSRSVAIFFRGNGVAGGAPPNFPNPPGGGNIPGVPGGQPPKADGDEIAKALDDLKSNSLFTRKGACEKLRRTPVDAKRRDEVAKALVNTVKNDTDHFTRMEACAAAGVWGNSETVTDLTLVVAGEKNVFVQRAAIDALGELRDERAAPTLVTAFVNFHLRENAGNALKKIGSPAEKSVYVLLTQNDGFLRRDACNLLKEIGTRDSIPILQTLLKRDRDAFARQAAQEALITLAQLPAKSDPKKDPKKDKKDE